MGYGTCHDAECPCGVEVTVVSFREDPPPIPIKVKCEVYKRDDLEPPKLHTCWNCGFDYDSHDYDPDTKEWSEWKERRFR